jgi:acyl-CoA synthetase (AMP-forming)/AMP-acid ligase II
VSANADSNVAAFLLNGKAPGRVALRLTGGEHTYGELRESAAQVARYLLNSTAEGDRVLLISNNSLFWVAAYLGILQAGRVCVPLPHDTPPKEVDYILEITGARLAFVQSQAALRNASSLRGISVVTDCPAPGLPALHTTFHDIRRGPAHLDPPLPAGSASNLAALMFTSGSTSRPRGVMVSHSNIIANTESIIECLDLNSDDRMMAVLPFHYCFGASLLHTHLRVGASLVVDSRFMYPEAVLQRMIDLECTGFAGVPSHFQILLRSSSLRRRTFPRLRRLQQAGGRLAPSLLAELREALPDTQVFVMYGQTEATARLSYLDPKFCETRPGSIGKAIPGVRLRVLNESGNEVSPGETGEIVAEGRNVALGYWRAPEETARSFRNGALYTGDLATVDGDGFIYIVDRARNFIKCGGKRVSCRQLEDEFLAFEQVLEVAVTAIPDDVLGEAVKVFVAPRAAAPGDFKERFHRFCIEHLPPQLVPKEIAVLNALPKNSSGKVLKPQLQERCDSASIPA